jgi:Spy/CpxP family protein refolding chaperone
MKKQVLGVLGVLAVAGLAFAQAPAPTQERQRGQGPAGVPGARMRMGGPAQMAEALGLTEQQKAQIEKLRAEQQRAAIKRRADQQLARFDLAELLKAQTVDEKAVALRVKELTDLHGAAVKAHVDHLLLMKKILTPEQQEKMKQMRASRPGMGPGAGKGRRMMRGPRPGGAGGPGLPPGDDLEDDEPSDGGFEG